MGNLDIVKVIFFTALPVLIHEGGHFLAATLVCRGKQRLERSDQCE
jgi:hypothetical protein